MSGRLGVFGVHSWSQPEIHDGLPRNSSNQLADYNGLVTLSVIYRAIAS